MFLPSLGTFYLLFLPNSLARTSAIALTWSQQVALSSRSQGKGFQPFTTEYDVSYGCSYRAFLSSRSFLLFPVCRLTLSEKGFEMCPLISLPPLR